MDDNKTLYQALMQDLKLEPVEVIWSMVLIAMLATGLLMGWDMGRR